MFLYETEFAINYMCSTFATSFINESKHRQIFCRGVLSYSEIYIGKGPLWFRLFFILLPFLLCPATKSWGHINLPMSTRSSVRHINLPMSTRSSVRLTSFTVFELRILYFEGCLIRILIKNSQKDILLNLVFSSRYRVRLLFKFVHAVTYFFYSFKSRALIFWTQTKASAYQQYFEFYQKMLNLVGLFSIPAGVRVLY